MLVVSDASPLNFLVRMQCISVLPTLFSRVLIPQQVKIELSHPNTPEVVRCFMTAPPAWLEIRVPSAVITHPRLAAGEAAAMALALESNADFLLVDERAARLVALQRGVAVIGLLGIIERAAERGLLNFRDVIERRPADYRIEPALIEAALARDDQRRRRPPLP